LFETLWLNLTTYGDKHPIASLDTDSPVWERPAEEPHKQLERPKGYLDYLTWQSRTLRLHLDEESETVLARRVSYAQGRKLDPPAGFYDPMMAYFRSDKDGDRAIRFNEYRDLWRDSAALFQFSDTGQFRGPTVLHTLKSLVPSSTRYKLSVFGLCTDKAKVNFWRHESLPLPLAYLDNPELVDRLQFALKLAEEVASVALRKAAWATVANRLTGDTGMTPDKDRVQSLFDSFAPQPFYWSRLERPYRELLVALADATSTETQNTLVTCWFE
jgi:CRISPR system Cascade subunit CasA